MHRIRSHPLFFVLVAISAIAIGVEAWFVFSLRRQERVLEVQLNQKIAEIERLQRQRPGPTDENLRRAREDFAQNAEVLATMLRSLRVSGPDDLAYFDGEPTDSERAWLAIADFVDVMRKAANEAGVVLRPDERFGFAAYTHEGPKLELIRSVHRQLRVVGYLLEDLFPARPRTLVSIQREDPQSLGRSQDKTAGTGPAPAGAAPVAPRATTFARRGSAPADASSSELFTIDPQVSARTPGYVDTMAFRITFTGQTSCLRAFMNALAVPEIPLVVRSVEVEPLRAEPAPPAARSGARSADGQALPVDRAIVADNESRFIVTVELFDVKLRAPDVAGATPTP